MVQHTELTSKEYRQSLFHKKTLLEQTATQLKSEFVGIDTVIEQLVEAASPWFLFPEMQERPVIVNLWGLTGIGKTSLVRRFVELIDFGNYYYRFDLGESAKEYYNIQEDLQEIYDNCNHQPFLLSLDEFQHARTLSEKGEEMNKASSRVIWDLLDNGKFELIDFHYGLDLLAKLIRKAEAAVYQGVEIKDGLVIQQEHIFRELFSYYLQQENDEKNNADKKENKSKPLYFIPECEIENITRIQNNILVSNNEIRLRLNQLDAKSTIEYLLHIYRKALKPKVVDCSKALIFVMGNLDEVYSMTHDFNPDMSADEFHRQSLEITITQVKNSLSDRFRSEQIARLGNIHIIYPTFNRAAFMRIIQLELDKTKDKIYRLHQINAIFDASLVDLIYEEGVYPSQGTRPIFTTIHQIINSRLGRIFNEIYLNDRKIQTFYMWVDQARSQGEEATIIVHFMQDNLEQEIIHSITEHQPLTLGKLRKEKRNDEQALVAVHESGHAILASLLLKNIPQTVVSVTADSNSEGFILTRPKWKFIAKKEIIHRVAVLLGGFIAEQIVFGEENVTVGAESDISSATRLVTQLLYNAGMGDAPIRWGNQHQEDTPDVLYEDSQSAINQQARDLMEQARTLAQTTLTRQYRLLLKMADYLSNHRVLNQDQVLDFLRRYALDFDEAATLADGEHVFYRSHLKELCQKIR